MLFFLLTGISLPRDCALFTSGSLEMFSFISLLPLQPWAWCLAHTYGKLAMNEWLMSRYLNYFRTIHSVVCPHKLPRSILEFCTKNWPTQPVLFVLAAEISDNVGVRQGLNYVSITLPNNLGFSVLQFFISLLGITIPIPVNIKFYKNNNN